MGFIIQDGGIGDMMVGVVCFLASIEFGIDFTLFITEYIIFP